MKILDEIQAFGHSNVLASHRTTLELTTEKFLTKRGNCILGINSTKSVSNFSLPLKKAIQAGKKIKVEIQAGPYRDFFIGIGNSKLTLTNGVSMVFRISDYISDRTALIKCSKGSILLNRNLISYLQDPTHSVTIKFYLIG